LTCQSNQLANLDVSNSNALTVLWCSSNQLTFLDISKNSNLGEGVADPDHIVLDIGYMPRLQKVCVWTMPFPPEGLNIFIGGSPNVYFTTECSK